MTQITLDGDMLADASNVHEYLKEMLSFPEYYGKNLDALHDCLTELDDIEITIEAPLEDGAIYQKIIRIFKAAAKVNKDLNLIIV